MGDAADMATEQGLDVLSLHERGECDRREPCQLCDDEQEEDPGNEAYKQRSAHRTAKTLENYRDMRDALRASMIALDDWLNTYASEFCDEERVKEAGERIMSGGGTLAYIADLQERNRRALGEDV